MHRLRLLALLLLALALAQAGGCTPRQASPVSTAAVSPTPSAPLLSSGTAAEGGEPASSPRDTLTLAIPPAEGAFDPFFSTSDGDRLVLRLTQLPLMARNADGSPAPQGSDAPGAAWVKLTLRDDGSAVCRLSMREDIRFADGSFADVDDLLFVYQVLLDPTYDGPWQAADCAVRGLARYRTATDAALYEKYRAIYVDAAAGRGPYADSAETCIREAWLAALEELTAYCRDAYLEAYCHYALGLSPDAVREDPGALRVFTMWCAGLAENADGDGVVWDALGGGWQPGGARQPDEEALLALFQGFFETPAAFDQVMGTRADADAAERFIRSCAAGDPAYQGGPAVAEGLQRVDDYTLEITLDAWREGDLDRLCGGYLVSRQAGEQAAFGQLDGLRTSDLTARLGAGAYLPDGGGRNLYANELYYRGAPNIEHIRLAEMPEESMIDAVYAGRADAALLSGSRERFDRVRALNGGRTADGPLTARQVATEVYGYLALSPTAADPVTGETAAALRQALLAALRRACADSASDYFGDAAKTLSGGGTEEELYATLQRLLEQAAPDGLTVPAYVAGDGLGDHPCCAGLHAAAAALEPMGLRLTVTDEPDEDAFWAAVDGGQAAVWAAARRGAAGLEPDQALIYQRQDLALFRTERVDLTTLPDSQSEYHNWLDEAALLALRQPGESKKD